MIFESLPNEIFLDLFDYFDGVDLFRAFYGLSGRFNSLLYNQHRTFFFNFHALSKRHFDVICQQHLPKIADRVVALSFSDSDDITAQFNLFFSYIPSLDLFTHLRSISLSDIVQYELAEKILEQCHHLDHLTHLKCEFDDNTNHDYSRQSIIDHLWTLPKLVHCETNSPPIYQLFFHPPTKPTSLKSLSLNKYVIKSNQMNRLFHYTPHLKYLSLSLDGNGNEHERILLPLLTNFKLCVSNLTDSSTIVRLLQDLSNLHSLQIDLPDMIVNGCQWEDLIRNYLPKLVEFRFRMIANLSWDRTAFEQMNETIDSFRSVFWINEHRWFVRCFILQNTIHLCTLPNLFPQIDYSLPNFFSSTDSNDDLEKFCNDTTGITRLNFFDDFKQTNIRLMNIEELTVRIPIQQYFWNIVPNLNKLHSLVVHANRTISQFFFQDLFDRTPHLRRLTIYLNKFAFWELLLLKRIHSSLDQVNLQHDLSYFNEEECLAFARSPLGVQCEMLSINVWNGESVLILVQNISRLRLLKISCYDIAFRHYSSTETVDYSCQQTLSTTDELVEWLKNRLPASYIIAAGERSSGSLRIWM